VLAISGAAPQPDRNIASRQIPEITRLNAAERMIVMPGNTRWVGSCALFQA
jgi:hypothetical protein